MHDPVLERVERFDLRPGSRLQLSLDRNRYRGWCTLGRNAPSGYGEMASCLFWEQEIAGSIPAIPTCGETSSRKVCR